MEIVTGKIVDIREDGKAVILADIPDLEKAIFKRYKTVEVGYNDGRTLSPEQRKKAYALLGEIADWQGSSPEYTKDAMKLEFITRRQQSLANRIFSLSNADVSTVRNFISFLIDFMLEWDIPSKRPLVEYTEDIQRYVYSCLLNKKCAVCGREAVLHHCEGGRIGMGNNRNEVNHIGRPCLPLCAAHHDECHHGEVDFMERYHLEPVRIDERIAKVYRLRGK